MTQYRRAASEGMKIQGKQSSSRLNQPNLDPKNGGIQERDLQEKWEFLKIVIVHWLRGEKNKQKIHNNMIKRYAMQAEKANKKGKQNCSQDSCGLNMRQLVKSKQQWVSQKRTG